MHIFHKNFTYFASYGNLGSSRQQNTINVDAESCKSCLYSMKRLLTDSRGGMDHTNGRKTTNDPKT